MADTPDIKKPEEEVRIENASNSEHEFQQYKQAEIEPKLNWQTVLAFFVSESRNS